ncbi:MAG: tetratricopeptide repeat protein [Pyrinomonadaceae bacterium]|nr:tetratricopeptide repeat protein [Pyrinomonadaceae bacterium]
MSRKISRAVPGDRPSLRWLLSASICVLLVPAIAAAQGNTRAKRLERAASLINSNQLAEAEHELGYVLRVAPNEAVALNLLGTIRATQGRLKEAESLFLRAVRADKQLVGAHMNLAHLYLLKGAPAKTIAELREVVRLDPKNTEATHKLARVLLSQNQVDECITFIESVKQSQPRSAGLLVVLGDAYLRKGKADQAEENYLLALTEQSENADAILGLARITHGKGDNKTATLYLFRARELVGNSPDLLYRFALVAVKLELLEEAKSALERAINLKPNEPAYLLALGALWIRRPDFLAAEQAFRRAIQLRPDSAQAQMSLGYVLFKKKEYSEARLFLERSTKLDTNTPEAFYILGLIAQEQGDHKQAIEIFDRLVQRFPEFSNAHLALGLTYLTLKNYQLAQRELELAVKMNPDEPKAHYQLALLYARLNDQQRAQEQMRIVEKLKNAGKRMEDESDVLAPAKPGPR